jgi:hypothetical protein
MSTQRATLAGPVSPLGHDAEVPRADRALTASAVLWAAIKASTELRRIGARAAARICRAGGNRGPGEQFEDALAALLTADVQAAITADVIGALPGGVVPGLGRVKEILWLTTPKGSRKGFDCVVQTTTGGGAIRHDWVNVKRRTGKPQHAEAVAASTLLRVAQDEDLHLGRRVNVSRTIVQFAAGAKKIATSDYVILAFQCAGKKLVDVHAQGLLSTVKGDKLAMFIHSNRAVVQYVPSDVRLPDDFDVNAAFWRALIRTLTADDLRLHYVALAAQSGLGPAQVTALAVAVDEADDETMFAVARAGLEQLCPGLSEL